MLLILQDLGYNVYSDILIIEKNIKCSMIISWEDFNFANKNRELVI